MGINLFNRAELYVGNSIKEFSVICDILDTNNIDYKYKVSNRTTSSSFDTTRARTGSLEENKDLADTYYIYVKKTDYENAQFLIRKSL